MKIKVFFALALALGSYATYALSARSNELTDDFSDVAKLVRNSLGNGSASVFAFNTLKFDLASEAKKLKDKTENYTGCNFITSLGQTENIANLANDKNSGDKKETKKAAAFLAKLKSQKELLTILQMHWDGVKTENAGSDRCAISIYRIYGVDGSGLSIELEATD